jgi:4-aminobutyrate aminotransferase-like enzyme
MVMSRQSDLEMDPRVQEAKRLLMEAMVEHRAEITSVVEPDEHLKKSYDQLIQEMSECRGGALYYPYLATGMGSGPYVELGDGSVKMDMITGIGVHILGHMSDPIVESHWEALLRSTIQQGHLQQSQDSFTLLKLMLQAANAKRVIMDHGVISSSGAMANENAIKLAFHHRPQASRVLAFERCFHGRTMAMAAMTDKAAYRQGLPLALDVDYVPFYDANRPEESTKRAMKKLESVLQRYPDSHALMAMELIQGEGGFRSAPKAFFQGIMARLKEAGILVWVDEVQSLGRTDEIFAYQSLGLDEYMDIVTLGKMSQVCATLYRAELKPKPGLISQTFTSSTSAIMAGIKVFEQLLDREQSRTKISHLRQTFQAQLKELRVEFPYIGALSGEGAMLAFTLGHGDLASTKAFLNLLFEHGVIGFLAGASPCKIRFLPPWMILDDSHMAEFGRVFKMTVQAYDEKMKSGEVPSCM